MSDAPRWLPQQTCLLSFDNNFKDGRMSDSEAIANSRTVYCTVSAILPAAESRQEFFRELLGLCSGHRPGDRRGYSGRHAPLNGLGRN